MLAVVMQYALYLAILVGLAYPLGGYIKHVMMGERVVLSPVLGPVERGTFRLLRIDRAEEMDWRRYLACVAAFSVVSFVALFCILVFQNVLPGNPNHVAGMSWDLAFNTAASFVTNTNWQAYSGEASLSWFAQAAGLAVQNFVTPAVAMGVLFALIRGFVRTRHEGLGSFWVDLVRGVLYVLLPIALVMAVVLVAAGVPQSTGADRYVRLDEPIALDASGNQLQGATIDTQDGTVYVDGQQVQGATIVTEQLVPAGTAASQVAIKQLGTNGGGYFGTNSANPLENPNALTNLIEMIAILLIPAALCFSFGLSVGNRRQGWAIFAAMGVCLVVALAVIAVNEQAGTLQLSQNGAVYLGTSGQAGGNMEGKEVRFGIASSSTWAAFTTAASNGSVNCMHDSLTPLAGMACMLLMQLGEVVFGGVGCGLYGMLAFAILTVFVAGLMVGRTPEFLGKKIEPFEMKWSVIACLATPVAILVGSAVAAMLPQVAASLNNSGAHGLSELLYTYSSAGGNNGSAFAGFDANTVFLNLSLGVVMMFARFVPIVSVLAIGGNLSGKRLVAATSGTLKTDGPMFVFLLVFIVILIGALSFFPALSLGPVAEFLGSAA
ncbi:MAG: potassium-transporting ATPase subunit KdpA [Atopobiaceae bacterium]|jgi:K+-transporting ATPase ATPase A chain|nr:potassium-transporting ATPase subunit KdpA [Atopobiaceae bacterium]MCH4180865.1 potassium-transporting ATPase subunit KdpA [Atopobiaceae bacterium]MCH4213462.1 potassium-transporting ATPase subunit KdpA [Atopobiaceae bacterium]MCH4230285.1 potassium-transporting ATPase subunit KdpA [Atopobiaceae bacterium]MCH4277131.1 potassium-transporting ATPase subunit KdpA [Atopobiaceae bacterium]